MKMASSQHESTNLVDKNQVNKFAWPIAALCSVCVSVCMGMCVLVCAWGDKVFSSETV